MSRDTFIKIDRNRGGGRSYEMLREVIACTIPGPRIVYVETPDHVRSFLDRLCEICSGLEIAFKPSRMRRGLLLTSDGTWVYFRTIDEIDRTRGLSAGPRFVDHHARDVIASRWLGQIGGPVEIATVEEIRPGSVCGLPPWQLTYRDQGSISRFQE